MTFQTKHSFSKPQKQQQRLLLFLLLLSPVTKQNFISDLLPVERRLLCWNIQKKKLSEELHQILLLLLLNPLSLSLSLSLAYKNIEKVRYKIIDRSKKNKKFKFFRYIWNRNTERERQEKKIDVFSFPLMFFNSILFPISVFILKKQKNIKTE